MPAALKRRHDHKLTDAQPELVLGPVTGHTLPDPPSILALLRVVLLHCTHRGGARRGREWGFDALVVFVKSYKTHKHSLRSAALRSSALRLAHLYIMIPPLRGETTSEQDVVVLVQGEQLPVFVWGDVGGALNEPDCQRLHSPQHHLGLLASHVGLVHAKVTRAVSAVLVWQPRRECTGSICRSFLRVCREQLAKGAAVGRVGCFLDHVLY